MGIKINSMDDTIAAISTPIGEGGIGIVRMSGPLSLRIADAVFVPGDNKKASSFKSYTTHYGHVFEKGAVIDEVILTVMRAPKSYTKEDVVEINCHGGAQAVRKVLRLVLKHGARMADPGEFTKRAFLNGRIDLAKAEAVMDVIRAKTEASLKVAMDQLGGVLSGEIEDIRNELVDIAAELEASIDFPDEGLEPQDRKALIERVAAVSERIKELSDSYNEGMIYREGVLATICGKPNVGKSSLMNLLLKRDRVIVSPVPGTTRDAVEEMINLGGIPVRLVDTAGISETEDALESEGIKKSKKYLDLADMIIVMLDASANIDKADMDILRLTSGRKRVIVINKCDLKHKLDRKKVIKLSGRDKVLNVSVGKVEKIKELEKAIADMIVEGGIIRGDSAIVTNARHKELLDKALADVLSVKKHLTEPLPLELVLVDLNGALYSLGLVVGKSVSDDILERIFEKFCVGK